MYACQLVNVFGVLSREYPRDYVFIAFRSALRNFCRSYRVICPPFNNCSLLFSCVFTRSSLSSVYVVSIIPPEVSTYWRDIVVRDPTPIALWGVVLMSSVLISNRWALDFSVLL